MACIFNWHHVIDSQLHSFAGNPATVIEVRDSQVESACYIANEIERRELRGSVRFHSVTDERSEWFAEQYKDGEVSFCFIDGAHDYSRTMAHLKAWYPKVHFNSMVGGHGSHINEVMRAVRDFFAEKDLPVRTDGKCWYCNHCHKPKELW